MKHFSFVDQLGYIRSSVTVPDNLIPVPPPGCTAVETAENLDPNLHFMFAGTVSTRPPKPDYPANFDPASGKWLVDVESAWAQVRLRRDQLISSSDWVVLPDVNMPDERKRAWMEYRQALRDVTRQADPTTIIWPKAPV